MRAAAGIGAAPASVESIIEAMDASCRYRARSSGSEMVSLSLANGGRWRQKAVSAVSVRGDGRQGRHFHDERSTLLPEAAAGFGQQGSLIKPQLAGPDRGSTQKHKSVHCARWRAAVSRAIAAGKMVAQSFIQRIQRARAIRERVECDALRAGLRACGGVTEAGCDWRHDEHELGV